jgi:putative flippase GtrA
MSHWQSIIKPLFLLKSKFLLTSILATALDIGLYLLLFYQLGLSAFTAQAIAYPIAVLFNFLLQKWFIFESHRKAITIFGLAMLVSGIGYLISLVLVYCLDQVVFLHHHQLIIKGIEKGILFFYNFYFKRFAFEKRFI